MNISKILGLILCCVMLSLATVAQNPPSCLPSGTWYGGSNDVKYVVTISPITADRFSATFEVVMDVGALGLPGWTTWSGEFQRTTAIRFVGHMISLYTTSSEVPPPPNSYEMDAARATIQFSDCDHMKVTYDFYGVYFDLNKIPFVDLPDINVEISGTEENYRRMPTTCQVCVTPAPKSVIATPKH